MPANEKLEEYRACTASEVILADHQRLVMAAHAAECELGPCPDSVIDPKAYKAYEKVHHDLTLKIMGRLI